MKNFSKLFLASCILIIAFACKKETNAFFANGNAVTLTSSTTTIAAQPSDSSSKVLVLSWTNPKYSTDSAHQKFTIEMDSSGRNFADEATLVVNGPLSDSLTAKQINDVLLSWGFAFGVAYPVDVRVTSSYANNNEQYVSNVITLQMTPYKIPPKIPVPANLYIVGDAVSTAPGTGWNNPVNAPYQQLSQLDETTFGGVFNISSGSFLLLPVNGSWDHKYGGASATGGDLLVDGDVPGSNTPAPATPGWYKIIVNFQTGTYSVTAYTGPTLPVGISAAGSGLWIIGDATGDGWNNDAGVLANQQFTQYGNADFQLTTTLNSTGSYLLLPIAGDWSNKYGGATDGTEAGGGTLLFDNDVPGSNTKPPATTGTYKIDVNFVTGKYTVTPQ